MIGERTGASYGLGDTVTVKLMEAAPVTGGLRFELADGGSRPRPPRPGQSGPAENQARFKPKKR